MNSDFGFDAAESVCSKCDLCNAELKYGWEFEQPLALNNRGVVRNVISSTRGAVVRAEAQGSDDPCVPGSNPTVGRGCRSFG
jgi:hypothetical protein